MNQVKKHKQETENQKHSQICLSLLDFVWKHY